MLVFFDQLSCLVKGLSSPADILQFSYPGEKNTLKVADDVRLASYSRSGFARRLPCWRSVCSETRSVEAPESVSCSIDLTI